MTDTLTPLQQAHADQFELAVIGVAAMPGVRIYCETLPAEAGPMLYIRAEVQTSPNQRHGTYLAHDLTKLMAMPYAQAKAKVRESVITVQHALVTTIAQECSAP